MPERDIRERDILVAPNEYAYVQDLTKGDIVLYVGPTKISLSNTERMIVLRDGHFEPVRGDEAGLGVHRFVEATSSQYIILENPPQDPQARPVKGANSGIPLRSGRKNVVPGPAEFPLWPGQRAQVIDGHELRQNEYLVVRVYDDMGQDVPIGTELIVRGTDVSFYIPPSGREVMPKADGGYVRRAWRMEKNKGLHVRVLAPFEAGEPPEDSASAQVPPGRYLAGQDIFLRGREGLFFPTDNLEVVGEVAPVPLAEKEAIYVRALDTGKLTTVEGPINYLLDPTREELVRRPLDARRAALYQIDPDARAQHRALSIYVPPSTAVMVTAKNKREVVVGPQTRILAYDEELEVLRLSTGRPKSDDELLATCFLQVQGNKVSDLVRVKTGDHVELEVLLSYRVSFVGDSERWFNVKDYVGLLCDHLGSIIRAAARSSSIEDFQAASTDLLRSAILGPRNESGAREGRHFQENGMWVYDVEVLDVRILDQDVKAMLGEAQRMAIMSTITRRQEELRLGDEQLKETVNQAIYAAQMASLTRAAEHEAVSRAVEVARANTRLELDKLDQIERAAHEAEALGIRSRARLAVAEKEATLERQALEARAAAFREQMQALQPELIATLKSLAGQKLAGELSRHLSPLAILGGESVAEVAGRLLDRLPLGPSAGPGRSDIRGVLGLVPDKGDAG
jgi:major vault protein